MSQVLLVLGHPDLAQSKANKALVDAVRGLAHVTVHDLYAAYPTSRSTPPPSRHCWPNTT
ncbi:hypothetical protein [Streptomyces sp. NPDC048521]|uniref:hypothetical protein n=1 Tax=Streptomyces sp. NPDC048521 TaxID=3365566 RepID=UPI00371E2DB0